MRIFSILIIFLLIGIVASDCYSEYATATVSSQSAKVYQKKSDQSKSVITLKKGAVADVLESSGEWIKIQYDDKIGWARKKNFKISDPPKQAEPKVIPKSESQKKSISIDDQSKTKSKLTSPERRSSSTKKKSIYYGIKASYIISSLGGDDFKDYSSKTGFGGGFGLWYYFSRSFGVELDVLYSMKGAVKDDRTLTFSYTDFPLNVFYYYPISDDFKAGASLGAYGSVNLLHQVKSDTEDGYLNDFNPVDYGIFFGIGADYSLNSIGILIDFRYYIGMANLHKAEENPMAVTNNSFSINFGIKF